MSDAVCSPCACPTPAVVNVPGTAGNNGTDGINAYTLTTASFTVPAGASGTVTISVVNNSWMAVGQNVFIEGAGMYQVTTLIGTNQVVITHLSYVGNAVAGTVINSGAKVSPGATQPTISDPLPVANGGTNSATAVTALSNLGAAANGANGDITSLTGLTTALSIGQGGTGAKTVAAALAAFGLPTQFVTGTFVATGASAVTVSNAAVTANSVVIFGLKTVGGTVGAIPAVKTITVGVGFTVAGTASDTSTYQYLIIN